MVIDAHPAHIVDSGDLHHNIIFGVILLDKCCFHLDFDQNLIQLDGVQVTPLHYAPPFHTLVSNAFVWSIQHCPRDRMYRQWLHQSNQSKYNPQSWYKIQEGRHSLCCLWSGTFDIGSALWFTCCTFAALQNFWLLPWVHIDLNLFSCASPSFTCWKFSKKNLTSWFYLASLNHSESTSSGHHLF